jgi:hypothetical protein
MTDEIQRDEAGVFGRSIAIPTRDIQVGERVELTLEALFSLLEGANAFGLEGIELSSSIQLKLTPHYGKTVVYLFGERSAGRGDT